MEQFLDKLDPIYINDIVSLYNFAIKNKNLNEYITLVLKIFHTRYSKKISKITGCKISIKKSNDQDHIAFI